MLESQQDAQRVKLVDFAGKMVIMIKKESIELAGNIVVYIVISIIPTNDCITITITITYLLLIFNDIFLFMKYYSMHNFTSQYVGRFNGDGEISKSKWLLVL